jgi:hypothetical protein
VWTPAQETPTSRAGSPAGLNGASTTEPTRTLSCILIEQMRILRATTLAEVPDLHDLWQHRNIDGTLCRFGEIVPLEDLFVLDTIVQRNREHYDREGPNLVESSLVPVLL